MALLPVSDLEPLEPCLDETLTGRVRRERDMTKAGAALGEQAQPGPGGTQEDRVASSDDSHEGQDRRDDVRGQMDSM